MVDYLTYYYTRGTQPFRSLSALPLGEAIQIMQDLFVKFEGSILFERFRNPAQYLQQRRQTEQWVREEFIAKGGHPQEAYPISMVLGASRWIQNHAPGNPDTQGEMRIPLSILREDEISFTYPDSMISLWFGRDKPPEYYQPEFHGQVFTLSEIQAIVGAKGLPEDGWATNLPETLAPYIEAQVWSHVKLIEYASRLNDDQGSEGR
jgi:hypothetical protein